MEKVAVIGLGLIGGSLALELKKRTWASIYGIDKNPDHLKKAKDIGLIIDEISPDAVKDMDVVIVSVPVNVAPQVTLNVLDRIDDHTLVFDVGSTKAEVCKAVEDHPKRKNFVAVHPIAGTEFSGPEAAIYDLFTGKVNIICERAKSHPEMIKRTLRIFELLGMRNVFMDSPKQHDKHIAYVSHLSHISSFMLGKTVLEIEKDEKNIFNMAGSGFASTVRLAKSNPDTWTPIFLQNKKYILRSLNEYIKNLEAFREIIADETAGKLHDTMKKTNRIKKILDGIKQ